MNETQGMARLIHAEVIKGKLAEIKKVSSCLAEQSQAIHDYFLGESPTAQKETESPKGGVGYFYEVRNGLDDARALLEEAMNNLIVLSQEIGIDRKKISERPESKSAR